MSEDKEIQETNAAAYAYNSAVGGVSKLMDYWSEQKTRAEEAEKENQKLRFYIEDNNLSVRQALRWGRKGEKSYDTHRAGNEGGGKVSGGD